MERFNGISILQLSKLQIPNVNIAKMAQLHGDTRLTSFCRCRRFIDTTRY